jgi:hypothetical protein
VISTTTRVKNAQDVTCFRLNGEDRRAVVISEHFLLTPLPLRSLNGLGAEVVSKPNADMLLRAVLITSVVSGTLATVSLLLSSQLHILPPSLCRVLMTEGSSERSPQFFIVPVGTVNTQQKHCFSLKIPGRESLLHFVRIVLFT